MHPASYMSVYIGTLSLYVRSKEKELNTNNNETLKLSVCLFVVDRFVNAHKEHGQRTESD